MYMPSNAIEVKVHDAAGTIVLNCPDFGNTLTRSMVQQLIEAIDDLYLEKRVRAIIITGAGDSFSSCRRRRRGRRARSRRRRKKGPGRAYLRCG